MSDESGHMTVGELRTLIDELPDDTPVACIYDGSPALVGGGRVVGILNEPDLCPTPDTGFSGVLLASTWEVGDLPNH